MAGNTAALPVTRLLLCFRRPPSSQIGYPLSVGWPVRGCILVRTEPGLCGSRQPSRVQRECEENNHQQCNGISVGPGTPAVRRENRPAPCLPLRSPRVRGSWLSREKPLLLWMPTNHPGSAVVVKIILQQQINTTAHHHIRQRMPGRWPSPLPAEPSKTLCCALLWPTTTGRALCSLFRRRCRRGRRQGAVCLRMASADGPGPRNAAVCRSMQHSRILHTDA